jgi:hypothetical protein
MYDRRGMKAAGHKIKPLGTESSDIGTFFDGDIRHLKGKGESKQAQLTNTVQYVILYVILDCHFPTIHFASHIRGYAKLLIVSAVATS